MEQYRRVSAVIDLDAVAWNLEAICRNLQPGTKLICVVKTDGYGHGALPVARLAERLETVWGFAAATVEEGLALRAGGIRKPILLLGFTFPEDDERLAEAELQPAVFQYERARLLSGAALRIGKTVRVHLAVDTGMSRIGWPVTEEAADEAARVAALDGICVEGVFTHFSKADESDKSFTCGQLAQYNRFIELLEARGVSVPLKHCSNSAGIIDLPEANRDAVRAGIILYGLYPSKEVLREKVPLRPAMELKSHIVHVKTLEAGRSVSYGGTYRTESARRIATVPVGYGDGYPRSLSNRGEVLIRGRRAPIAGRICMDQFMVDVTDIPEAGQYDPVTLVGTDGEEQITVEELSELSGRFNYEFVCCIGSRVPRVYRQGGRTEDGA